MVFAHSQTTNKLVNEAVNDSGRVSGQDRKIPPTLRTNQIARFGGFRPLASVEKIKVIIVVQIHLELVASFYNTVNFLKPWLCNQEQTNLISFPPNLSKASVNSFCPYVDAERRRRPWEWGNMWGWRYRIQFTWKVQDQPKGCLSTQF